MIVNVSRRAIRDIDRIAGYLGTRSPDAALGFETDLQNAFDLLQVFPQSGREMARQLRRLVLTSHPYLIFYRIVPVEGVINIITIRHAARRPEVGSA